MISFGILMSNLKFYDLPFLSYKFGQDRQIDRRTNKQTAMRNIVADGATQPFDARIEY